MSDKKAEYEVQNDCIIRETTDVNGYESTVFVVNGKRFDYIEDALQEVYVDQGGLYLRVFGVDPTDASKSQWHPEDTVFNHNCSGWTRFLKTGGIIEKQVIKIRVDVKQHIRNDAFWRSEI